MHSVCSFRLLCRVHCVWSSNRQNGLKNDKLTRHEDGRPHINEHPQSRDPISVTWTRRNKTINATFPWYIRGGSKCFKPGYYYRRGQNEQWTRKAKPERGDEISYSTTIRIQSDLCGDADPSPSSALQISKVRKWTFAAPAVNQPKKQQLDQ